VSKHNTSNLLELADKISIHKVDIWKVYQFAPLRGRAKDNNHLHSVDNQMFAQIKDNILFHSINSNVDISFCDNDELQNDNLLIAPNGDIIKTMKYKDNILGNIKLNQGDFVYV
jgi:MoaA/NifB/PqqE/SkfB family radical SAM enzyme